MVLISFLPLKCILNDFILHLDPIYIIKLLINVIPPFKQCSGHNLVPNLPLLHKELSMLKLLFLLFIKFFLRQTHIEAYLGLFMPENVIFQLESGLEYK